MPGNILAACFDLLWPRECPLCGALGDRPHRHLCAACLMKLDLLPATGRCSRCGLPVPGFGEAFVCEECRCHPPAFDRATAAMSYGELERQLILDWKSRRAFYLRADLTDLLVAAARAAFDVAAIDAVVAMPPVFWHRLDRGYDHIQPLAEGVAAALERRRLRGVLSRCGWPRRQAGLGRDERLANVKGTFKAHREQWLGGRTLLLIDDVMTTGATLSEAALTLKRAGAAQVWALTVARALPE